MEAIVSPLRRFYDRYQFSAGRFMQTEAAVWEVVLKLLGIVGAVATIVLGVLAIWLALYFYRRANEINNALIQMVARIEASSKSTEVTSTQFTGRLIDAVTGTLDQTTLDQIEEKVTLRILERLKPALQSAPASVSTQATKGVEEEVAGLFSSLRIKAAPTSPDYDWGPFVRRIHELETQNKFISLKWLNETKFVADPAMREALQVAIKNSIVELYRIDNPKNPVFPTTACRLAVTHPTVVRVLRGIDGR